MSPQNMLNKLPFLILLILFSCGKKDLNQQKAKILNQDRDFLNYIASYTTGTISNQSEIIVELNKDLPENEDYLSSKVLTFSPNIDGELKKFNNRTLIFTPAQPLENGVYYSAELHLKKLFWDIKKPLTIFDFAFETLKQDFSVSFEPLRFGENNQDNELSGKLLTADKVSNESIEKMLSLNQPKSNFPVEIVWEHQEESHYFTVSNIQRDKEKDRYVSYKINGKFIGIDKLIKDRIKVVSSKTFTLLSAKFISEPAKYISITFSDPLDPNQNLQGLIEVENNKNLTFEIDKNEIKVYLGRPIVGKKKLTVHEGIKSKSNRVYQTTHRQDLRFTPEKPALKFVGKGTILPSSKKGIVLPFEAVNLKSVDVTIIKIFDTNVPQFLQNNRLSGSKQMKRVGKDVVKKTISLETFGHTDLQNWNRFYLDLNTLITQSKGAIYRVELSFRQHQSLYPCDDEAEFVDNQDLYLKKEWKDDYSEYSYWDNYYVPEGYKWKERKNPCHVSYYTSKRKVAQNIIASDLGLIAKIGNDRNINLIVTNLLNAEPEEKAHVELLDFQLQPLASGQSDSEGFITLKTEIKPFLAVVKKNGQYAYLRLDDGSSLSLSNFDVAGLAIKEGLKGFIYGERGVWRPGDTIHLTLLLEDKEKRLPLGHPIVVELTDPLGNLKVKLNTQHNAKSMYAFNLPTESEDLTGVWKASIRIGQTVFQKSLKVETIRPNRLKSEMTFEKTYLSASDLNLKAELKTKWLTGVEAGGLKAKFDLQLVPSPTLFKGYSNYIFTDFSKNFDFKPQTIFESTLDPSGKASINYKMSKLGKLNRASGFLKAIISGKVFERGGNFSIARFSIPYYPYRTYVGLTLPEGDSRGMLLTDKNHKINIVTLNTDGQKVNRKNISVTVYKMTWKWWWDQSNNKANYVGSELRKKVFTSKVSTINGLGSVDFKINYPDWGRYYVKVCDEGGHCSGKVIYMDWPGWASKSKKGLGSAFLSIETDKKSYKVGENIELLIPSTQVGKALVSIENGSKIIDKFWVDTKKTNTKINLKATADMTPNIYINTTLIQPHAQTENNLPIRLYGIRGIDVIDENTKLYPEISLPQELQPSSEVVLNVKEKNGQAMAYSIAIVDEGLLDLTNYKTPDPWSYFYSKEGLGVKTWDLYSDVIGAFGGQIDRLLAIGGSDYYEKNKKPKPNRFKPVAIYLGPFFLDKNQTKKHTFKLPAYIGSVRAMIVSGYDSRYGSSEKTVPVRQPLMVLGSLPRVLGPGEKVKLPVSLLATEANLGNVRINVKTDGVVKLEGSASKTINIQEIGDKFIDFNLEVMKQEGHGKIYIEAESNKGKATHEIEIQSRNPNPLSTKLYDKILMVGEEFNYDLQAFGTAGTNSAVVEFSTLKSAKIEHRLNYLINYPHGCLEQTISKAFPQLYVGELVELDKKQKIKIENNIKEALKKIIAFQTGEGAFTLWTGNSQFNYWLTNYAGHFMIECKNKGYTVNKRVLKKWQKFQRQQANIWQKNKVGYNDDFVQAYRLFTLALAGGRPLGLMNRFKESNPKNPLSKWRLAAAYALIGQKSIAESIIKNISSESPQPTQHFEYHYSTPLRESAMILETLTLLGNKTQAFTLANNINETLSKERWLNTQEMAYALLATSKFLINTKTNTHIQVELKEKGQVQNINSTFQIVRQSVSPEGKLYVKNKGKGIVYLRIIQRGKALENLNKASSQGLAIKVAYFDSNNKPIDPKKVAPGTDLIAAIAVTHKGLKSYQNLALTQIFPSGWEILNTRLNKSSGSSKQNFDYQDIRDDRVLTYFKLGKGKTKIFGVQVNTSFKGRYYLPAILVEDMYDNTIYAKTEGQWVEVN